MVAKWQVSCKCWAKRFKSPHMGHYEERDNRSPKAPTASACYLLESFCKFLGHGSYYSCKSFSLPLNSGPNSIHTKNPESFQFLQISESGEWFHWTDVIPSYLTGPNEGKKLTTSQSNTALLRSMFDDEAEEDDGEGSK